MDVRVSGEQFVSDLLAQMDERGSVHHTPKAQRTKDKLKHPALFFFDATADCEVLPSVALDAPPPSRVRSADNQS